MLNDIYSFIFIFTILYIFGYLSCWVYKPLMNNKRSRTLFTSFSPFLNFLVLSLIVFNFLWF